MKTASFFLCAAVIVLASASCGKHTWKETQVLHEKYQHHGEEHGTTHAESHSDAHDDKPAAAAEHGEKKAN